MKKNYAHALKASKESGISRSQLHMPLKSAAPRSGAWLWSLLAALAVGRRKTLGRSKRGLPRFGKPWAVSKMKRAAILTPHYSLLIFTGALAFIVGGALTSGANFIKEKERDSAVIDFMLRQPLYVVANVEVGESSLGKTDP